MRRWLPGALLLLLLAPASVRAFVLSEDELEEKSTTVDDPEHLAEAVDIARASLDDAVSLSDQLLESFRSAQQVQSDEEERS